MNIVNNVDKKLKITLSGDISVVVEAGQEVEVEKQILIVDRIEISESA